MMEKMAWLTLLIMLIACYWCSSANSSARNKTVSEILDGLLKKERYESRLRPNCNGKPVEVTVGFWVLSIDAINLIDMDFSLDIFFRQEWKDERLDHGLNTTMFLSNTVMDRIWIPDSYFVNAKHGSVLNITTPNMMIIIMPGGVVKYSARINIKAACPMDLRKFPMDTQHCPLTIESCESCHGYSEDHITFKWEKDITDGMPFVPSKHILPQYSLATVTLTKTFNQYVLGNWSGITATFAFERMASYFFIHVYGPCALIVIMSWVSFLLPRSSPTARVTVCATSVLTVVTILNMLNNSMPKVSYITIIDKYLIASFLFVFATLVEYALVLFLAAKTAIYQQSKEYKNEKYRKVDTDPDTVKLLSNGDGVVFSNGQQDKPEMPSEWLSMKEWRKRLYREEAVQAVDEYSLIIFPISFAIFNVFYWVYIANDSRSVHVDL